MEDQALIHAFENDTLAAEEFPHSEHVRLTWLYLNRLPLANVLAQLPPAIRSFATRHGAPEKYHETITWAFILLIHERLERGGRGLSWENFQQQNADLMIYKASPLHHFYSASLLQSDLARQSFVMPDRLQPHAS